MADPSKTEAPTPRRRSKARERGEVARSVEVSAALGLLAALCVVALAGARQFATLKAVVARGLRAPELSDLGPAAAGEIVGAAFSAGAAVVFPIMVAVAVLAIASNLVQVGFIFSGEPIKPQLQRINPVAGLQRVFSRRLVVEGLKGLIKTGIVAAVIYVSVKDELPLIISLGAMPLPAAAGAVGGLALRVGLRVALAFIIVAGADCLYQRLEHEQRLRMTRQELKDDLKETEGDPHIRARVRERARQVLREGTTSELSQATVVVTNPVHIAIALRYDPVEMEAPKIVAKGRNLVANRILAIARAHSIPIWSDRALAQALYKLVPLGRQIPRALYKAVAAVLAGVYRAARERAAREPVEA